VHLVGQGAALDSFSRSTCFHLIADMHWCDVYVMLFVRRRVYSTVCECVGMGLCVFVCAIGGCLWVLPRTAVVGGALLVDM